MRIRALPSTRMGKWCALGLLLVLPGSLIVLPLVYLARWWRLIARG